MPRDVGGVGDALDREVALDLDRLAVEADVLGGEADLRVALGVEEVGRLQVAGEVLVLDVDARDLGRALEADGVVTDHEGGVDLAERCP